MSTDLLDAGMPTPKSKPKEDLNNANTILTLGIISIVLSLIFTGYLGLLLVVGFGASAITKGRQAMSLYNDYPNDYTKSSYSKAKAGFICGVIGVGIWGFLQLIVFLILAS